MEYHIEDLYVDERSEIAEADESPIKIVLHTLKEEYQQPGLKIHRLEDLKLQKNFDFYEEEIRLQKKKYKGYQYLSSKFEPERPRPLFLQSDSFENLECDCYFCDTIFKTRFDFENHLSSFKHKQSSKVWARESRENLQCDLCKTFFTTKCGLRNHAVIFHEDISCNLHCHKCKNRYKLTGDFLAHMKECEGNCRRRCKKPVRKIVSIAKNRLKCYICKKNFVNQNRLSKHVEKHLISEKKSKLRELSHKVYTFSCKDCKILFSTKFALLNHIAKSHKELIVKVKCPVCKKKCKSKRGLSIHMRKMHGFTGANAQ